MELTLEQRQRVAWLVEGYLDDANEATFEDRWAAQFALLTTPQEFFLFVASSSAHQEPHEWRLHLGHLLCDRGTALLIFWRCSPVYYCQFTQRTEVPEFRRESYDLVHELADRLLAGTYPAAVHFDPTSFKGVSFLQSHSVMDLARVPAALCLPSPGVTVPLLNDADYQWGHGF